MPRSACSLFVALVSSLFISTGFAQHIGEDGRLVFPERRITAFAYLGADESIMRIAGTRITTREGGEPGSWVYEWRSIAEHYEALGDTALAESRRSIALEAYLKANIYYALAWFPGNYTAEEQSAYESQLDVYQKAGALFEVPLEVVDVPFRDGVLTTYVHRPVGVERPPLVIWTGGSDQYKANHYRPAQDLLDQGLAVVTFDLPGFGESKSWPSDPTSDEAHMAVLGYFIERGDFDSERLGLVGVSWGGHFSTRVAARNDPRIDGVVALCGAAHELFSQPVDAYEAALQSPERMTIINLARHMQVEATAEAIQAALSRFSLLDAGIVGAGKTITTPLLIVNSTTDPLAPLGDLMMVHEAAANSDIWLLGTSPHCAVNYWPVTIPQIAGWLVDRMNLQPGN